MLKTNSVNKKPAFKPFEKEKKAKIDYGLIQTAKSKIHSMSSGFDVDMAYQA